MAVVNGIKVTSSVVDSATQREITKTSILPHSNYAAIRVTVENKSGKNIKHLNVTVAVQHNQVWTQDNSDASSGYTIKQFGHEPAEIKVGAIRDGETRWASHFVRSEYDNRLNAFNWSCYRIYGQYTSGEDFEHWFRAPVVFGISKTQGPAPNASTSDCFIATAAYQNHDHPMVRELRIVRDEVLNRSRSGRRFTAWYYRNGPALADIVKPRPTLRFAARAILTPVAKSVRATRSLAAIVKRAFHRNH
jgi:hypothetical protein